MRNKRFILGTVISILLIGSLASAATPVVAGIELPNEDDVLVQMLVDDKIPMEERTELINETLMHIYPSTLPTEERSRGLMRLVKRIDAPLQLRYLAAATMVEAGVAPPELGVYLVAECKNELTSKEWLSFCLRQLDAAYFRGDSEFKREVIETLTAASGREQNELAGTALLTLWRICEKDDLAKPALQTLNRALLSTKGSDLELMIASLEVAASMRDSAALPIAKRLAYSNKYGLRLRLAAVNAILTIGSSEDAAKLTELRSDKNIGIVVNQIIATNRSSTN